MLKVRLLLGVVALTVLSMNPNFEVDAGAAGLVCLLNECGPPAGIFTIFCELQCKLAGWIEGGTCSGAFADGEETGEVKCQCHGPCDPTLNCNPAILLAPLVCIPACPLGCLTCGYKLLGGSCYENNTQGIAGCSCTQLGLL